MSQHGFDCSLCSRRLRSGIPAALFTLFLAFSVVLLAQADEVSFSQDVLPILKSKCLECHGNSQPMSNLDMRNREGILRGGLHGPAIVPGKADESQVYLRVSGRMSPVMPMGGSLSDDEILTLKVWINQGAKWDTKVIEGPNEVAESRGGSEKKFSDREWWAFRPPIRHAIPQVKDPRWSRNPIDAFLKEKLDAEGLVPVPRADRRTLIRRAYLDLVGLLPPLEEVERVVTDDSPDAFRKLVDRLLATPGYGERWGRHWLDVARYADSGGYEHDYDYPHAWRYRDYVIKAFNEDKPYDQFIREQLAGDELDEVTYDTLVATGFNRVGPTVGLREKDNPQYRYNYLDDMIGTTSRAFMALTVNCARCHDHKFDPILQKDYYQMMAIFFPFVNYDYPLVPAHAVAEYEVRKAEVDAKIDPLRQRVAEIQEPYVRMAFEKKLETFPKEIQVAILTPEAERTEGQKLLADQVISIRGRIADVEDMIKPEDRTELEGLEAQIAELEKELPKDLPRAMGIRDGDYRFSPDGPGDEKLPGKGAREDFSGIEGRFLPEAGKFYVPPAAHLLPTGDHRTKGPVVEPGFLRVLARGDEPTSIRPSTGHVTSGRRRALAEWIASEDNPLTARVMGNRIWHFHFGRGIVTTPGNFGRTGQSPVYPKLLDWLATEFVRGGWSVKSMHRLIMNSEAYQMASSFPHQANQENDPAFRYLWKYPERRLEAEIIRDMVLHASGNLNRKMGGEPYFLPIPESVRLSFPKGRWQMNKEGSEVWRRSVYSYWKRGLRYPMFEVFDLPNQNVTCQRRDSTTVPTQALTLLNNEFVLMQAKYFAARVAELAGQEPKGLVTTAYRIALSRDPSASELSANSTFLRQQERYHRDLGVGSPRMAALTDLCDVVLNLSEFIYIN